MSPLLLNAAIMIVAGLLFGYFILPKLVELIVWRVHEGWRADAEIFLASPIDPLQLKDFAVSPPIKTSSAVASSIILTITALGFGLSNYGLAISLYLLGILLLAIINIRHYLLPDIVVYIILWSGLIYRTITGDPHDFVLGAIAAYMTPYAIQFLLKAVTNKKFIGAGDLKCFAMAAAWLGVGSLPTIFTTFLAVSVIMLLAKKWRNLPLVAPTGVAHVGASVVAIFAPIFF